MSNNAAAPYMSVELVLFGGLFTEATPESLPMGASPLTINCEYEVGQLSIRPGKQNAFYFASLFLEHLPTYAISTPGAFAPNEIAWANPTNIELGTIGQYASVPLNQAQNATNVVQFKQQSFNVTTTTFTGSFNSPVSAGNTVFIAFFINDPNGVTEGVNMPSIIDDKGQGANHINQINTGPLNNQNAFAISQSSAVGGQQNYTFHLQTNAAGTLTASTYAVCMVEIMGTANTSGADPVDQLVANPATGNTTNFSTGATVNTAQANELLLGVVQQLDSSGPDYTPFITPGPYFHTLTAKTNIQKIGDYLSGSPVPGSSFNFQCLLGENLATNPNAILLLGTVGVMQGFNSMIAFVTLKMLNTLAVGNLGLTSAGVDAFGASGVGGGGANTITLPTLTTHNPNEACLYFVCTEQAGNNVSPMPYPLGSPDNQDGNNPHFAAFRPTAGTFVPPVIPNVVTVDYACVGFSIPVVGQGVPWPVQDTQQLGIIFAGATTLNAASGVPWTAGNTLIALVLGVSNSTSLLGTMSISNSVGDAFNQVGISTVTNGSGRYDEILVFMAQNIVGGNLDVVFHSSNGGNMSGQCWCIEYKGGKLGIAPTPHSQILRALNFNFAIPSTQQVLGYQVIVEGHQTNTDPSAILTLGLAGSYSASVGAPTFKLQLPAADAQITVGTPTSNVFNLPLSAATFNDPNLGFDMVASITPGIGADTVSLYGIELLVWLTPNPPPSYNYLKTFAETGGEVLNLALGSDGVFYQEDAINSPGTLTGVFTNILPNSFAESVTQDDREFIAISNLQNGTDVPRTYTPPNFDRLSQVGPGQAPTCAGVVPGGSSAPPQVSSITQQAAVEIRRIGWGGAGFNIMNDSTPGSQLIVFGEGRTGSGDYTTLPPGLALEGAQVVLSGIQNPFPKKGGGFIPYNINGLYTVQGLPQFANVNGGEYCPAFLLTAPGSAYGYSNDFGSGGTPTSNWFYQPTLATMTAATQVPGLQVGGQFQLTGTGGAPPAGYDGTWTVVATPNAAVLQINSVLVNGNVATYSYTINTGVAPTVGQNVSIQGVISSLEPTLNLNPQNVAITAVSPSAFSIAITNGGNLSNAPGEPQPSGQVFATVAGTTFTFDPGQIVTGTHNAGTITVQTAGGITPGVGQRKCCYSFLTRNGYMTQPSPITTFDVPLNAGAILVSNLLLGPSNVIARVIHLTAANGGNFYNIPEDVPTTDPTTGVSSLETSTWILDNVSTSKSLSFGDATLLSSDQIDITGNNLFETIELGSPTMLISYGQRVFAIGEQNKVPNFINWSFDGGIVSPGTTAQKPAGWSVVGSGVTMVTSPVFGWSLQISNTSGVTVASQGMITQTAYQDEFLVAIINASTTYSVRVTALTTTPGATGNIIVDLYSTKQNRAVGTFSQPISSLTSIMAIYTGTLLTTPLAPVPTDLTLRVWCQNISAGAVVQIDRVEVFPTEMPNLNQEIIGSYQGNFEAFDRVTGIITTNVQNQQPSYTAFTLFDSLYIVKFHSLLSTTDNKQTEPNNWPPPRIISNAVGTTSIYGVTTGIDEPNSGEEWALIAGIPGAFIFNGGAPVKLSEEIQSLWNLINWRYGFLVWIKNDIVNRRILIGCPMTTLNAQGIQNPWIPAAALNTGANPTFNNCILELNYKQLNTEGLLAERIGVRTSYSAKLIASEITRKWSVWTIRAPCAAFLQRNDTTAPLFLGNSEGNAKIFELIDGFIQDDGAAIWQGYTTYGFVSGEQGQGMQMGVVRYNYDYLTLILTGLGTVTITVYPNSLVSPFSHTLLPNITLPASLNGDVELPVNECGSRLFLNFNCNAVGSFFTLNRLVVVMHQDPWAPVRGVNTIS